jgi:serine phosphatase RsbU (regulator of sigma subunit)
LCVCHALSNGSTIKAERGVINLSTLNFNDTKTASLNGEWLFFADTLIAPQHINKALQELTYTVINVPTQRNEFKGSNFGTYYLHLTMDSTPVELCIYSLTIYSSASIFVNNKLVGNIGTPGSTEEKTKPGLILHPLPFYTQQDNELVIHYANFHREKNGLANNINLVKPKYQIAQSTIRVIKYAIIIGTILFIIFNQINYFFIQRNNRTALYFGMASLMIASYIVFMSIYHLGVLIPDLNPNFYITLKTWRIAYYFTVYFFTLYIYSLFTTIYHKSILYYSFMYSLFSALLTLFAPLHISSINFNLFMYSTLFLGLHGVLMGIIGKFRKIEDSGLFLFGFAFFIATVANDILHNLLLIKSVNLLDVGIFGMMLTQAQIINLKLNRSLTRSENLSQHLQYVNANLEGLVTKRTEEIEEQKAEIEAQRDFALSQHMLIANQKKTITDSINYAREIQQAVLPDEEVLKKYFSDSFILFKPKDYVSGDFYWIRHFSMNNQPYLLFCAADCTGHGVPGAFLSMLGMSLLGEIISHNKVNSAAEVLELLREKFKQTLCNQKERENSSDGMHITLCLVNKQTGDMHYSGAFQALYHIRNSQIRKIKGTNCIIGNYMYEIPFENHIIPIELGDRIYLFTDGFADQMADNGQGRFMQKRLVKLLTSFEGELYANQRNRLNQEFESWKGTFDQIDDVLVMGIKV